MSNEAGVVQRDEQGVLAGCWWLLTKVDVEPQIFPRTGSTSQQLIVIIVSKLQCVYLNLFFSFSLFSSQTSRIDGKLMKRKRLSRNSLHCTLHSQCESIPVGTEIPPTVMFLC